MYTWKCPKSTRLQINRLANALASRCVKQTFLHLVITIVPSQRDVKCTSLVNVLGYIDSPCMLRSAPIQREVKSTRLVNAIWRGRYYCILKYALSRRDVKSTCVVEAFGEGVF